MGHLETQATFRKRHKTNKKPQHRKQKMNNTDPSVKR